MARILLATFGSYGDLHPYLAVGIELRRRGHQVAVATSPIYAAKVRSEDLAFVPVRPDITLDDGEALSYVMDARHGPERIVRFVAEQIRESYEDTLPAVRNADLVVTHPLTFGAVLSAQRLGVPWISTVLAPFSLLSAHDPPVQAAAPWMSQLRAFGPGPLRWLMSLAKRHTLSWIRPLLDLRRELALPTEGHPLFEGQHAPRRVLALFSKCLAQPQPDWPPQTVVTGFPFYDRHHEHPGLSPELERFLESGSAPIVFSLGSSAVGAAGDFYTLSLAAARRLGRRALFLTGRHPQGLSSDGVPADVLEVAYAAHSELFPRAAVTVHHGGIGTTSQAMLSGRPMLVVPFAHDQFDNGARVRRLGIAEVLPRKRYTVRRAEQWLRRLLEESHYAERSAVIAAEVRAEKGAQTAADEAEAAL